MSNDNNADYLTRTNKGQSFVGSDVEIYRALLLATSIRGYAKHGMLPTRGVSATGMLKMATSITGKKYKRGQFEQAAVDLTEYANVLKATPRT